MMYIGISYFSGKIIFGNIIIHGNFISDKEGIRHRVDPDQIYQVEVPIYHHKSNKSVLDNFQKELEVSQ